MDIGLRGKVALVTGGARGIGAAFCEALALEGAKVVVADVLDGASVVERIASQKGIGLYVHADITKSPSIDDLIKKIRSEFGDVEILVNNAAIFADLSMKPFQKIASDEWDRMMAVNVRGAFECSKAVTPAMMNRKSGKIVNISSGTVFKGTANMLHYVVSKGAIVAMTRCLARELGPYNICVNGIAPGLTMSEAVKENPEWAGATNAATVASRAIKRNQDPRDLIGALLYLCSPSSDFVTGQTLTVDGGSTMR